MMLITFYVSKMLVEVVEIVLEVLEFILKRKSYLFLTYCDRQGYGIKQI